MPKYNLSDFSIIVPAKKRSERTAEDKVIVRHKSGAERVLSASTAEAYAINHAIVDIALDDTTPEPAAAGAKE